VWIRKVPRDLREALAQGLAQVRNSITKAHLDAR
jgi:hypothetical protein